ncbi:MAG: hypothetical protein ACXAEF_09770 [Candidatus Thorarchaeota archaeon]
MTPASTFDLEALWDSVFAEVDLNNIRTLTQVISTQYPQRIWYPLDRNGTQTLLDCWEYVNDTISDYTDGELHFNLRTSMLNLVAIKEGTDSNLAPIIISAIISSRWSPGANGFAASVAAVLECARVLHDYDLANDVYFVFTNSISYGYSFSYSSGNQGMEHLLNELVEMGRTPSGVIWFNRLLYFNYDVFGQDIRVAYDFLYNPYDPIRYVLSLSEEISEKSGTGQVVIGNRSYNDYWIPTGAFEGWERGIPSITVGQFYNDFVWTTEYDTWNYNQYQYDNAVEAVGLVCSLVTTLGNMASGDAPEHSRTIGVGAYGTYEEDIHLTGLSYVNISITWDKNFSVAADLLNPSDSSVYFRNETDQEIQMSYLVDQRGQYTLQVTNSGNESIIVSIIHSQYQDLDWDGMDDYEEYLFGTDSLTSDTDSDFLSDPDERTLGTNPRIQDTDSDGAFDGIEVLAGCDPLVQDTDSDSLLDGFELSIGLDPTLADSDQDGLNDDVELDLGVDPLNSDSDRDGLSDYIEYMELGTDPLSPDSDGDGLSDLFEVLNALNPLSTDTDLDGLSDAYEVEHCLMPFDADTDRDGIPDGQDWAPTEHWINTVPFFGLGIFTIIIILVLVLKRRAYMRGS